MNCNRVTLQHNNEFVIIIFCYLMVSVIKRLIRATFLSTPTSGVHEDENKRHGQAIKIAREATNNQ